MKKSIGRYLSVLSLLLLLSAPAVAFQGASSGLQLWASVVLPTLLPFMICCNAIVAVDGIRVITFPFRFFLRSLLGLSDSGCFVLLSGLLCGYPMGAKICSEFRREGKIGISEAQYLFAISNHPNPMFLLGYVLQMGHGTLSILPMMLSVYLPILPISQIARHYYRYQPEKIYTKIDPDTEQEATFDDRLMSSFETMMKIGGYIMLFSVLSAYISQITWLSPTQRSILLGITEITTGIQAISKTMTGSHLATVLLAVTVFGGFSGILQTKSVIKNSGLSISQYIIWKAIHSLMSCTLFYLLGQIF